MKKYIKNIIRGVALVVLLSILVFLVALKAKGQQGPKLNRAEVITDNSMDYGPVGVDGSVMISGLELEEVGDSLRLAFNVEVNRRAINNRQTWRILPELSVPGTGNCSEFPTLLITGRQKERHFKRKVRFGNEWLMANYPDYKATIPKATDTVLHYRITIPYEGWMDNAHLTIHQYLASPKEKRQLFSSDGYGMVKLQPQEPYVMQPVVEYIVPGKEVKRRSAGYQALVDFPVNVSRIIPDYRRNPEELSLIDKHVRLIQNNPYVEIERIYMEGYASPEGGTELNARLAMERVQALKYYLVNAHGIRPGIIHINTVSEDWQGLRAIVDSWEDSASRERIIAVIDRPDSPEEKEKRLRALTEWVRLINEVFPLLRRTEYRIDFMVSDFTVEQARSLISTHPELFSHRELYMLARSYTSDPAKRLEILETILRYYPEDNVALNNYAAALIDSGEIPSARRYLDRMSDKSLAANNLGIICLLNGQYDQAERYFNLSRTEESLHNLQELRRKIEDNIKLERYTDR